MRRAQVLALLLLFLAGCAGGRVVTDDKYYVGDYRPGQKLVVVAPIFVRGGLPWSKRGVRTAFPESVSACGAGQKFYLIPRTLAEYEANPKRYHYQTNPTGFNVFGVLQPGTTLNFDAADYQYGPDQRLFRTAVVADGILKGTPLDIVPLKPVAHHRFTINYDCLRPAH